MANGLGESALQTTSMRCKEETGTTKKSDESVTGRAYTPVVTDAENIKNKRKAEVM
jgi:hypothetical protein